MKPTDRQWFIERLTPLVPTSYVLDQRGQAVCMRPRDITTSLLKRWYIDCPSWAGSTYRRAVGRFVPVADEVVHGCAWTASTERRRGRDWREVVLADFKRLALGIDQ